MRSTQLNEINEPAFPIHDIHDVELALESERFSEMIPVILDILEPHEELQSAQKKSKKNRKRRIAQKVSFKAKKVGLDFYNELSNDQLGEVLNFLYKNHQEERLINLYHSITPERQKMIIKEMLSLAFKANLKSYSQKVIEIRRRITKGYIKPSNSLNEAIQAVLNGDALKTVLFLNEKPDEIDEFLLFLASNKENNRPIDRLIREIFKWVPKGDYLPM